MSDLLQVSSSPHVRDRVKTDYIMRMVLFALLPAAAWGYLPVRAESADDHLYQCGFLCDHRVAF